MEIAVLVKHAVDVELDIRVKDGTVVMDGLSSVISSWDEIAVEGALQLTEEHGGDVTLVAIGNDDTDETLRKSLAMGASKAVRIWDDSLEGADSFTRAKVFAAYLKDKNFDLVLTGKQSQDTDAGLTGGMVAEFLDFPQVTNINEVQVQGENQVLVSRKGDHGSEKVEVSLPALLTANDSWFEPRLASLRGIMKAKKKPLEELSLGDLGVEADSISNWNQVQVITTMEPEKRKAGKKYEGDEVESVKQLMDALVNEAKVLTA